MRIVPEIRRRVKVGDKFGRLTVIGVEFYARLANDVSRPCFVAECECGEVVAMDRKRVLTGNTRSCGCLGREAKGATSRTHGMSGTRLHEIWKGMLARCYRKTQSCFQRYGGKGIRVCDEWREFGPFMAWAIRAGYDENLELDRRKSTEDYSPENCRWVTDKEQAWNIHRTKVPASGFRGVKRNRNRWAAMLSGRYIGNFQSPEDAARAYDSAAKKERGEFAITNFG